ncbi:MAG: penicillin-binding transpeptidase domain-containing protein [Candidatus Sumerlaeota bacterium]|nr:penicillin-binding transpeptidase domain-containing protein [Candidatus Sumerlaeota bacterium]
MIARTQQLPPMPEDDPDLLGRVALLTLFFIVAAFVLLARIVYLNAFMGEDIERLSNENYHSTMSIDAPRGSVFDCQGAPLATNQMTFNVTARAFRLHKEDLARSLHEIADLTGKDITKELDALTTRTPGARQKSTLLLTGLSAAQAAPILERKSNLPGIDYESVYRRTYPEGPLAGHILGHVGRIDPRVPQELQKMKEGDYTGMDWIGKSRLEKVCEGYLRGTKGEKTYRHDAGGRILEEYPAKPPAQPGADIYLTIDMRLQRKAEELLDKQRGTIIAMDPNTGALLAMMSYPLFDSNHPGAPIALEEPASAICLAYQGGYMPGSAFKLITAYAALKMGVDPSRQVNCIGYMKIPGWKRPFRCDERWGHGAVDMVEGIQKSCNVYFYTLARELGANRLMAAAREWGLAARTGLDSAYLERRGSLPDAGHMLPGEILYSAIGQGKVVATPLQMLRAYAALANGGRLVRPHVVAQIVDRRVETPPETDENPDASDGEIKHAPKLINELPLPGDDWAASQTVPLLPEWREVIVEGLWRVINTHGGTAYKAKFPKEWDAAGKTSSVERAGGEKTTAWFLCFAPKDKPVIAVLAMLEDVGHGGEFAAPLARDFLKEYFALYPIHALKKKLETAAQPPPAQSLPTQ